MTRKVSLKTVSKQEYNDYWKKAEGFFETMQRLQGEGIWNSTALEGIHAAILAADAVLIYSKGIKSVSQKHSDVQVLIADLPYDDSQKAARHLAKILDVKSLVEYSGDNYLKEEAQDISKHAERFFNWARKIIPK